MSPYVQKVCLAQGKIEAQSDGEVLHLLVIIRGWFHRDDCDR